MIKPGGLIIINSSLIDIKSGRDDVQELLVPANDIAIKTGSPKVTNMVMLAAYVGATNIVSFKSLLAMLAKKMGHKKDLMEINKKAIEEGRKIGATISA